MLAARDLRGVTAMIPTPCKVGADGWDVADSVDLDEAANMVEKLIQAGIGSIAACGTTGECAALLWEEKRDFIETIIQVNRKRVPVFAGATALGTKETVRQMRAFRDLGADGAFVGLPLWQTPTLDNSVQWFADLSEAVPVLPIMVYANSMFFKSTFSTIFWEGVARKAPTVIACKIAYGVERLAADLEVAGHQISFQPNHPQVADIYRKLGNRISACWSTSAPMGPEPLVALMEAIQRDDQKAVDEIWADISALPPSIPPGEREHFAEYNAQLNKWFFNASGYIKPGPVRAPYRDLPEHWKSQAEEYARAWAALRQTYVKAGTAA